MIDFLGAASIMGVAYIVYTWASCGNAGIAWNRKAKVIENAHGTKRHILHHRTNNRMIAKLYKKFINSLGEMEFTWYSIVGTENSRKQGNEPSRGVKKLEEVLRKTGMRMHGGVLSLCSGRGGWDYLACKIAAVTDILSITMGSRPSHPGHEDYHTTPWIGKEKIKQINADVTKLNPDISENFNFVLFDGGESNTDVEIETGKFQKLFLEGCFKFIKKHHGFVIKILNPNDPIILSHLQKIRELTGRGNLLLLDTSRNSNQEMYFVSTKPHGNLATQAMQGVIKRLDRVDEETVIKERPGPIIRENPGVELDYGDSIEQLGTLYTSNRTRFNHWIDLGSYRFGTTGSKRTVFVDVVYNLLRHVLTMVPNMADWSSTNTTPEGFMKTFNRKIDTSPVEDTPMLGKMAKVYRAMSDYYVKKGIRGRTYSMDEVKMNANRQGAAGRQDTLWKNVGDFLDDPSMEDIMDTHERKLLEKKPMSSIFNTMGKREKKKGGMHAGSRMVAFLPIPMRMLELKYLGALNDFVKPYINKCTVGGMGLHDFGMAVHRAMKGPYSVCLDIAGWDTRVSAAQMRMEEEFLVTVGFDPIMVPALYSIYRNPLILITVGEENGQAISKLLAGIGQRMSGTINTYGGNTISTLALAITAWWEMNPEEDITTMVEELFEGRYRIGMLSSGDDHFVTGEHADMKTFSKSWMVYNELGFKRKDTGYENDSRIGHGITNITFCSHSYEKVVYGGRVVRYQPTRSYGEIMAKSMIWIAGQSYGLEANAWAAAQAANLLLNYHHMRDCRRLAFAIRAIVPRNLVFTGIGVMLLRKPWLESGDIIEILNKNLFGEGTEFPSEYRLTRLEDLGYMKLQNEVLYNRNFMSNTMQSWRKNIPRLVRGIISSLPHSKRGDGQLEGMYRYM